MTNTIDSALAPDRLFPALRAAHAAAERTTQDQFDATPDHHLPQGGTR